MYQPIERAKEARTIRLYEIIVERIKTMILEDHLKAGDKLPSERELAEMFQVSRVPVREALKILEFMGIVQIIPGDGLYLKSININQLLAKIDFMIEANNDIIDDLFTVREALEMKAIELAAINRTENDLLIMNNIIKEMENALGNGNDCLEQASSFHSAIYKASKNKIIMQLNELMSNLINISREKSLQKCGNASVALAFHKRILDRINVQDIDGAKSAMLEHLKNARRTALRS